MRYVDIVPLWLAPVVATSSLIITDAFVSATAFASSFVLFVLVLTQIAIFDDLLTQWML